GSTCSSDRLRRCHRRGGDSERGDHHAGASQKLGSTTTGGAPILRRISDHRSFCHVVYRFSHLPEYLRATVVIPLGFFRLVQKLGHNDLPSGSACVLQGGS